MPKKRPKLGKRELERAHRRNKVFNLRMKRWSQATIAEKLKVDQTTVSRDIRFLIDSVGKKTAKKLKKEGRPRATKRILKTAYRLNRVFNLRMKGLTQRQIAKEIGTDQSKVSLYLKMLTESVGKKTVERLKNPVTPKMIERAQALNKVFNLRVLGLTIREIAEETGRVRSNIHKDLTILRDSVEEETAKKLRKAPKEPKLSPDEAYKKKWNEFRKKSPREIRKELTRTKKNLKIMEELIRKYQKEKYIKKGKNLLMQKNALNSLLKKQG